MTAFIQWAQQNYKEHPEGLAVYLYRMALAGPKDAIVWDYMRPREPIKLDTFLEIANHILAGEEPTGPEAA